ncbi:MAG: hypothetical protein WAT29_17685 [Thiolinea sp.]
MHWKEKRARENLVIHSESKDFDLAKKEWEDATNGLPCTPSCVCDICTTAGLHHRFEIKNTKTNSRLWVGSDCIEKFGVAVFDANGKQITNKKEIERQFTKRKQEIDRKACVELLRELWVSGLTQEEKRLVKPVGLALRDGLGVDMMRIESIFELLKRQGFSFQPSRFHNARKAGLL